MFEKAAKDLGLIVPAAHQQFEPAYTNVEG
jgi:hypothetical protein